MASNPLAKIIGRILTKKQMTLAVCESCTGGMLGSIITSIPGSSRYFVGGIVAYADAVKKMIVGVKGTTLDRSGAVSAEVAKRMASGVRRQMMSDIGIGITGIAGPTGGSQEKPVGLVYIGVAAKGKVFARRFLFKGGRQTVRKSACREALGLLRKVLRDV